MDALRWILLVIGAALILIIYLYSRMSARRKQGWQRNDDELYEPHRQQDHFIPDAVEDLDLDALGSKMHIGDQEDVTESSDTGSAGKEIHIKPFESADDAADMEERILVFYLVTVDPQGMQGEAIQQALEKTGLEYGDMEIFHYYADGTLRKKPVFSIANLVEPGTFDLNEMHAVRTPGLTLFMRLPGPIDSLKAFDTLVDVITDLKADLQAELKDKQRSVVSRQALAYLRDEIIEAQRKYRIHQGSLHG